MAEVKVAHLVWCNEIEYGAIYFDDLLVYQCDNDLTIFESIIEHFGIIIDHDTIDMVEWEWLSEEMQNHGLYPDTYTELVSALNGFTYLHNTPEETNYYVNYI